MAEKKTTTKKPVAKKVTANVAEKTTKKPVVKKVTEKKQTKAKTTEPKARKPRTTKKTTIDFKGMSPKEIATAKGEPWVNVLSVDLDPENIGNGAFELDWNEKFITNLIRAGYQGKTDADLVDQWFQNVCRNVLAENYEQWEANQAPGDRPRVIGRKDLGDGYTEVS